MQSDDLVNAARDLLNQLTLLRMPDPSRLWQLGGAPMEAAYQALKRAVAAHNALTDAERYAAAHGEPPF